MKQNDSQEPNKQKQKGKKCMKMKEKTVQEKNPVQVKGNKRKIK